MRCAACDEARLDTGTTLIRSIRGVLLVMRGGFDISEVFMERLQIINKMFFRYFYLVLASC